MEISSKKNYESIEVKDSQKELDKRLIVTPIRVLAQKKIKLLLLPVLLGTIVGFIFYSEVDNSLKEEDLIVISKILKEHKINPSTAGKLAYDEQIKFIRSVQLAILAVAPINQGIPEGGKRSPYILYKLKHGLCYDRSRTIEKTLRANGFETRHIFMFASKNGRIMPAIFNKNLPSHAVTEVKTLKGWLVLDSNYPWISITVKGDPIGIKDVYSIYNIKEKDGQAFLYEEFNKENIYRAEFGFIYGLYSRHGKFYPPFNFIPDINWEEFLYNF